ncbi:hypothetical protein J6590_013000 [Homalodisca vitripennis]|nr:hypothetical protein J6590_013000 [Homalodisca vitripennis]
MKLGISDILSSRSLAPVARTQVLAFFHTTYLESVWQWRCGLHTSSIPYSPCLLSVCGNELLIVYRKKSFKCAANIVKTFLESPSRIIKVEKKPIDVAVKFLMYELRPIPALRRTHES